MLAVVRIRGSVGVPRDVEKTLEMLRLRRVNHCVIVPKTPSLEGMLKKARNYLTWGEIKTETLESLILKRGRFPGNKKIEKKNVKEISKKIIEGKREELKIKPVFRLTPPSMGFRSVRMLLPKGDLGYRGDKINPLLERMM